MHHTATGSSSRRTAARRATRASKVAGAGLVAVAALVLSGCAGGSAPAGTEAASGTTTVRVSIAPTGTALPVVVADEQGFFEDEGLDVSYEVSNVTISDQLATLGRQFDVAMGTQPALLTAAQQGIKLVTITGGALDTKDNPQADFVAAPDSGIDSYADLGGKTLGALSLTGNIHYALLHGAKEAGVDLNSINWVVGTVPQLPDSLKAGRVQGIEEIEPFAGFAVSNGGVSIGDPFRSIGDEAYLGIFLSDKGWADANQDTVLKFNTALSKAGDWIAENQDDARDLLGTYSGAQGDVLAKTPIPDFQFQTTPAEIASELGPDAQTWIDILKDVSDFQGNVTPEQVLPTWAK